MAEMSETGIGGQSSVNLCTQSVEASHSYCSGQLLNPSRYGETRSAAVPHVGFRANQLDASRSLAAYDTADPLSICVRANMSAMTDLLY